MDFSKTIFNTFLFWYFLFLEAVVKAALFVVWEVGAIQVVINPSPVYLRHLRLVWQSRRKSARLPVAASPKGRLRTFPLPSLSSIGSFYTPASLRFLLSDCMACNQIFYFFIRICLFSVYLHFRVFQWAASDSHFRSGRKGNSGIGRECKVKPPVFGKNLQPCG